MLRAVPCEQDLERLVLDLLQDIPGTWLRTRARLPVCQRVESLLLKTAVMATDHSLIQAGKHED